MKFLECPNCGKNISDTYQVSDPTVGITGGWFCEECDLGIADEEEDEEVMVEIDYD